MGGGNKKKKQTDMRSQNEKSNPKLDVLSKRSGLTKKVRNKPTKAKIVS